MHEHLHSHLYTATSVENARNKLLNLQCPFAALEELGSFYEFGFRYPLNSSLQDNTFKRLCIDYTSNNNTQPFAPRLPKNEFANIDISSVRLPTTTYEITKRKSDGSLVKEEKEVVLCLWEQVENVAGAKRVIPIANCAKILKPFGNKFRSSLLLWYLKVAQLVGIFNPDKLWVDSCTISDQIGPEFLAYIEVKMGIYAMTKKLQDANGWFHNIYYLIINSITYLCIC